MSFDDVKSSDVMLQLQTCIEKKISRQDSHLIKSIEQAINNLVGDKKNETTDHLKN